MPNEQASVVRKVFEELPPADRLAVLLYYADGLTEHEISHVTERPVDAVCRLLFRVRALIYQRWAFPTQDTAAAG